MTPVAAGPDRTEALAALHAAAFPPAERWDADALAALLGLEGVFCLVLPGPGGAAGFVLARAVAGEAEVLTLAVHPAVRRRGHGAALLAAARAEAGRRGAAALFLEVAAGNAAALALYRHAGAEAVGLRRGYYPDGSDARVLRLGTAGPGS